MIAGHMGAGEAVGQTARGGDGIIDVRHAHEPKRYSLVRREFPCIFLMQALDSFEHPVVKALAGGLDRLQKSPPLARGQPQMGHHVLHPAGVCLGKRCSIGSSLKQIGIQAIINKGYAELRGAA